MQSLALSLIIFSCLPLVFKHAYIGIYLWSFVSYMNPHRQLWGFAYDFPFAMAIAAATLTAWVMSKEKKPLPLQQPLMMVWLCLIVWFCVTSIFGLVQPDVWDEWNRTIKIQLFAVLTVTLIRDREKLNGLVFIIAGSLGFFGVKGGLFAVLTGGNYLVWGPPESFIEGNNEVALAMITVIPLMRYLQMQCSIKWASLALSGCMLLTVFSALSSHSRGALLAMGCMTIFLIIMSRNRLPLIIGVCVLVPTIYSFMPDHYFDRMKTIETYEEDASAQGRLEAWKVATNIALDRPLIGGGFQAFRPWVFSAYGGSDDFHDVHSIYFEMLGEQGFVGLFLFLTMFFLAFMTGFWARVKCRHRPDLQWAVDLTSMVQVSLLGFAAGGAFLGLAYFDLPYHLASLMVIARAVILEELAKPPPDKAGDESEHDESPEPVAKVEYGQTLGELRRRRKQYGK